MMMADEAVKRQATPTDCEPESKQLKMSTTSISDEEDASSVVAPEESRKRRYKRRKVAIFFAYCGVGYQGMQKNPGAKTIEGELEEALFHSGAIPESDRGNHRRYDWARSARTDKGVSAVGQVVSGRFYVDPPGFVERLNSNLPPQIRIFGYKRVTPSFSARKFCDCRRYVYLLPVFALDPCSHRDRESVMASLGSGQEFAKCLECSERGRKVFGIMGKSSHESKLETAPEKSLIGGDAQVNGEIVNNSSAFNGLKEDDPSGSSNGATLNSKIEPERLASEVEFKSDRDAGVCLSSSSLKESNASVEERKLTETENLEKTCSFSYGEKEKEKLNRILGHYVGTHNFHNFTTRTKAEDPAARRFIISFHANTTVNVDGIDFVKCEVVGQSFMLHQIRKMIGLAVVIMRGSAPESLIETAFRKDISINVPMAPEVGLYLDECLFTSYNNKWQGSHEALTMEPYEDEAEDFKMKYIYSHIGTTETKEGFVALWLHSLNHRNYPDLRGVNSDTKDEKLDLQTGDLAEKDDKVDLAEKKEVEVASKITDREPAAG